MRYRIARRLACHDQKRAQLIGHRALQRPIQYGMSTGEAMAVKIDAAFGLNHTPPQPSIPAAIEMFAWSRLAHGAPGSGRLYDRGNGYGTAWGR